MRGMSLAGMSANAGRHRRASKSERGGARRDDELTEEPTMHDIDRVYMELESTGDEFSSGMTEFETLSEEEVEELASELLTVASEEELDYFLGNLFKKAAGALGKFGSSSLGKKVSGLVKGFAKKALPTLGGAAGNFLLPGVGGAIGASLASESDAFGAELDEEQQFEVAKQVVRLADEAAKRAAQAPAQANPAAVARAAVTQAARRYAPGLTGTQGWQGAASGRWVRHGNKIVLLGV
jgi:hypothetical protein